MKRLVQTVAALCIAFSLAGCCCCSPGYVDYRTGVGYGGGWEPCGFVDPFAFLFGCGCYNGCGTGCAPAAPCAPGCPTGCATPTYVGSYGGNYVGNVMTPSVISGYPTSQPTFHSVPAVPAGIYEEAVPHPEPVAEPIPAKTGSIIYQTNPTGHHHASPPMQDARNARWVPARL